MHTENLPEMRLAGAVATVLIRRRDQANRLTREDVGTLLSYWQMLATHQEIWAVVLTAEGRHFSTGYDIDSLLDTLDESRDDAAGSNVFADMVDALEALPQVTVCALNGGVFGGAADLALACDFRLGVPECRMFVPAARLGLQYYRSGLRRYVSRLGLDAAKRLLLLGEELDAQQMLGVGYLHRVVEPAELLQEAFAIAAKAASNAPLAIGGMKRALNAIASGREDAAAIDLDERAVLASSDLREGLKAWQARRPPDFKGL